MAISRTGEEARLLPRDASFGDDEGRLDPGTMFRHAVAEALIDPKRSVQIRIRTAFEGEDADGDMGFTVRDAACGTARGLRGTLDAQPTYARPLGARFDCARSPRSPLTQLRLRRDCCLAKPAQPSPTEGRGFLSLRRLNQLLPPP